LGVTINPAARDRDPLERHEAGIPRDLLDGEDEIGRGLGGGCPGSVEIGRKRPRVRELVPDGAMHRTGGREENDREDREGGETALHHGISFLYVDTFIL
jgi:hypothetical protein